MQIRPYGKVSLWITFNSKSDVQRQIEENKKRWWETEGVTKTD